MTKENLNQLYTDLQREYDLTLGRRKTLTGQATNLMSFAGVIETVLIALVVTLATNNEARALLISSSYYPLIIILAGIGFSSYIITAFFAFLAFREKKWIRIPQMPDEDPLDSIEYFYSNSDAYDVQMFAKQLSIATCYHQQTNDRKYEYLKIAQIFLVIGITSTAIAGLILLTT